MKKTQRFNSTSRWNDGAQRKQPKVLMLFTILFSMLFLHSIVRPTNALADNKYTDEQGVIYRLNSDGTTCDVWYHKANLATHVVIPAQVNGRRVISIGNKAFRKCSDLTSVTIPEGVTSNEGDKATSKFIGEDESRKENTKQ